MSLMNTLGRTRVRGPIRDSTRSALLDVIRHIQAIDTCSDPQWPASSTSPALATRIENLTAIHMF
jgi:hypothetical protein